MTNEQLAQSARQMAQEFRNLAPLFSPSLSGDEIRAAMITMTKFVHDRGPAIAYVLDELANVEWHDSNTEMPLIGEYYLVKGIRENRPTMCQAWSNTETREWDWHELGEKGFHSHNNTLWIPIP